MHACYEEMNARCCTHWLQEVAQGLSGEAQRTMTILAVMSLLGHASTVVHVRPRIPCSEIHAMLTRDLVHVLLRGKQTCWICSTYIRSLTFAPANWHALLSPVRHADQRSSGAAGGRGVVRGVEPGAGLPGPGALHRRAAGQRTSGAHDAGRHRVLEERWVSNGLYWEHCGYLTGTVWHVVRLTHPPGELP